MSIWWSASSAPGLNPVSVNYATANSTAGGGNGCTADYAPASGTLNFAPGETTKVVRVQILDCADAEAFEAFTFELGAPGNATIARASGRISIVDNDTSCRRRGLPCATRLSTRRTASRSSRCCSAAPAARRRQLRDRRLHDRYGTATAGADYTATPARSPSRRARRRRPSSCRSPTRPPEPAESFALGLSNATTSTIEDATVDRDRRERPARGRARRASLRRRTSPSTRPTATSTWS